MINKPKNKPKNKPMPETSQPSTLETVTFTLEEVNQILENLANAPAKYSMDLIQFIRAKAQEQINAQQAPGAAPVAATGA